MTVFYVQHVLASLVQPLRAKILDCVLKDIDYAAVHNVGVDKSLRFAYTVFPPCISILRCYITYGKRYPRNNKTQRVPLRQGDLWES